MGEKQILEGNWAVKTYFKMKYLNTYGIIWDLLLFGTIYFLINTSTLCQYIFVLADMYFWSYNVTHLAVVFEDISCSRQVQNSINDQFAVTGQMITPFMKFGNLQACISVS